MELRRADFIDQGHFGGVRFRLTAEEHEGTYYLCWTSWFGGMIRKNVLAQLPSRETAEQAFVNTMQRESRSRALVH